MENKMNKCEIIDFQQKTNEMAMIIAYKLIYNNIEFPYTFSFVNRKVTIIGVKYDNLIIEIGI